MTEKTSASPLQPPTGGDQIPASSNPNPSRQLSDQQAFITQPNLRRSGSAPRLSHQPIQHQLAATSTRQYSTTGQQLSFGGPLIRPGQQPPALPGHFNLQRQKAGMGMMNSIGVNAQIRGNMSISYAQLPQQRFNSQAQMKQQQQLLPQASLPSPQKLSGLNLTRSSSLASMNPLLPGLSPNGQSALIQSTLAQQQWLKQMQTTMPTTMSTSYSLQQQQQQRQQQAFLSQQQSASQSHHKSLSLSQQQISQLLQHQSQHLQHQVKQHQLLQQVQQFQQQHQQSPGVVGSAAQQSLSLMGSQPDTPAFGATTTGGSSGTEIGSQLLGKRKIQHLVSQVDSLGKLDPEVEDLLLEIADDFIDSVTTFACSLTKHRKSSTLDSNDLLLHLGL